MQEQIAWGCHLTVVKQKLVLPGADDSPLEDPYDVLEIPGNVLTYTGASIIWNCLTDATPTVQFIQSTCAIGVGDSTTAAAASQTGLQAATNKHYEVVDTVTHTEGTSSTNASISFTAPFESADGNFAWEEWGLFTTVAPGSMLNRKVASMGTKQSGEVWTAVARLTLS
jgi:hypothetical protein